MEHVIKFLSYLLFGESFQVDDAVDAGISEFKKLWEGDKVNHREEITNPIPQPNPEFFSLKRITPFICRNQLCIINYPLGLYYFIYKGGSKKVHLQLFIPRLK